MADIVAVTDATFESEVEKFEGVTMVDVGAAWCGPCRVIEPTVAALAAEYAGKAKIVALDADTNQKTTVRYGVRGLPTILYFKNGKVVDTLVGAAPRATIEGKLQRQLSA